MHHKENQTNSNLVPDILSEKGGRRLKIKYYRKKGGNVGGMKKLMTGAIWGREEKPKSSRQQEKGGKRCFHKNLRSRCRKHGSGGETGKGGQSRRLERGNRRVFCKKKSVGASGSKGEKWAPCRGSWGKKAGMGGPSKVLKGP